MEISIKKEVIFSGSILRLEKHLVRLADGGESTREVVRHPGAVAVVAFAGDELVLVKQYRFPVAKYMLELPAGKLDVGEEPEKCAARELFEETGYVPARIEKLTTIETSPGFSDETIHLFLAEVERKGDPCPDEGEYVEPVLIEVKEALRKIVEGEITDSKTISGVLLALTRKESDDL